MLEAEGYEVVGEAPDARTAEELVARAASPRSSCWT